MALSKPSYYDVKLDEGNIICDTLAFLQNALRHVMSNPDINQSILSQWWALGLVDYIQLKPLIENRNLSEQERMQTLFSSFNDEDPEIFRQFLVLLCNLKGCKQKSMEIRKIINQHRPGSVVLVCQHGNEGSQMSNPLDILNAENEVSTPVSSNNVNVIHNETGQQAKLSAGDTTNLSSNNTKHVIPADPLTPLLSGNVSNLNNETVQTAIFTTRGTNDVYMAVSTNPAEAELNSHPTHTDSNGQDGTNPGIWNKLSDTFMKRKIFLSGVTAFILLLIIAAGVGTFLYAKTHSSHEGPSNQFNDTNSLNGTIPVINEIGTVETSKPLNVSVSERDLGNGLRKYTYVQRNNITNS